MKKKLGCLVSLILIVALISGLFVSGIITKDLLMRWSENALVWSIDGLNGLLDKVQAYNRAVTEGKASILLVNASHPLPEDYKAENLVNLYNQKRSFLLAKSDLYLTQETFEAMNAMFAAAEKEGLNGFIVTSAYRSREDQARIYAESAEGYAQKPGQSEHETGLAFDVTARHDSGDFGDTEQCKWLLAHCHEYGFIQRYPEGKEHITGIEHEPWHYRYVGVEHAKRIRRSGLTLEEYLER